MRCCLREFNTNRSRFEDALYTLLLYYAVVMHGGKHNFWMLFNQVILVLANGGNVTLPVINVLYDFQIVCVNVRNYLSLLLHQTNMP